MASEVKHNTNYWPSRFIFLQKRWKLYLFVPLVWLAILCLRDFFFGGKIAWMGCIFFYLIKIIFYTIHYFSVKNYEKEKLVSINQNYIARFPKLQLAMYAVFFVAGIVYLIRGKPLGIPIFTCIFCSGVEDVCDYFELKRVFG